MDMQYSQKAYMIHEDELPDDIDCLFEQLPRVAPPSALIKRIVEQAQIPAMVASVAFSLSGSFQEQPVTKDHFECLLTMLGTEQRERSHLC